MSLSFTEIWSAFLKKKEVLWQSDIGGGRVQAHSSGWIRHLCTLPMSRCRQRRAAPGDVRSNAESRMSLGCRNEATRSFETVGVVFGGVGKGMTADKGKTWTRTISQDLCVLTDRDVKGEGVLWGQMHWSACRTCWILSTLFKWKDPEGSVNN